jgi:arsenate reductase (thioredoxin)
VASFELQSQLRAKRLVVPQIVAHESIVKQRILFLCTGNSARSQMAEALLHLIAGDHFEAESAGTHPAGLNPMTVASMLEIGVDVRAYRSKNLEEFIGKSFDYVITVCDRAKESCPVFRGAVNIRHWSFDDPAAAPLETRREVFRLVRDKIANRLCQFLIEEVGFTPAALQCYRCNVQLQPDSVS